MDWIPLERDRLMRAWEVASADEARVMQEVENDDTHGGWVWFFRLMTDRAREELTSHDAFAAWAKGWLTSRWQKRMGQLVELW